MVYHLLALSANIGAQTAIITPVYKNELPPRKGERKHSHRADRPNWVPRETGFHVRVCECDVYLFLWCRQCCEAARTTHHHHHRRRADLLLPLVLASCRSLPVEQPKESSRLSRGHACTRGACCRLARTRRFCQLGGARGGAARHPAPRRSARSCGVCKYDGYSYRSWPSPRLSGKLQKVLPKNWELLLAVACDFKFQNFSVCSGMKA